MEAYRFAQRSRQQQSAAEASTFVLNAGRQDVVEDGDGIARSWLIDVSPFTSDQRAQLSRLLTSVVEACQDDPDSELVFTVGYVRLNVSVVAEVLRMSLVHKMFNESVEEHVTVMPETDVQLMRVHAEDPNVSPELLSAFYEMADSGRTLVECMSGSA